MSSMDARERKEIMGQWGPRGATHREEQLARKLAEDLDGSPVRGRPILRLSSPFRISVEGYVTALGGPLPYMTRLREIEELVERHEERLTEAWRELADEVAGDQAAFARRWVARVERWNFVEVNELIERHNTWFPIEAKLPMDPKRRDYVLVNGEPYRRRRLTADWVLEHFPARLDAALAAA